MALSAGLILVSAILLASSFKASASSASGQEHGKPDVVRIIGPVSEDRNLNLLPHIPPRLKEEEHRLNPHNWKMVPPRTAGASPNFTDMTRALSQLTPNPLIPAPLISFDGIDSSTSGCNCLPPDTDGDVGPNHYVASVNAGIEIFNKTTGAVLAAFTTYNSLFSGLGTSTPCGSNQNDGDGTVFYDHMADRWVVSDFAFPRFPGDGPFYQCIGVSKTNDPVAGGWYLYALQVDPANPKYLGDYPKFGLWPNAYYLTMNEFSGMSEHNEVFDGVRVYALDRNSMLGGGSANAIGFSITAATLNNGNAYSLLPATFRFGAPPAGAAEYLLAVDSTDNNTLNTAVYAWLFHADFTTPANSTLGLGPEHAPNATITVNGFYDATEGIGSSTTTYEVPQLGATARLDTLGDKLMYPLYYQNLNGVESLWASQTVNTGSNALGFTFPTGIRWYQFNVTGGTLPAGAAQQQTYTNNSDGLWRFMPSNALDFQGNYAIGYSVSSGSINPAIRYAGRLKADSVNDLSQGENVLIQGTGSQTNSTPRWGDYSATSVDVSDSCTFYHTNEYYTATSGTSWSTRIGAFKFATCTTATPTPTPTPTPAPVQLTGVVSRMTHGSVGTFDVDLTSGNGIECRSIGVNGTYTLIFAFANTLMSVDGASITSGTGSVASNHIDSNDAHNYIVNLTGVSNAQVITVSLTNVHDTAGNVSSSVSASMAVLIGDTNADGFVNSADIGETKSQSGSAIDSSNFREDLNTDGLLNSADIGLVKSKSGTALP